MRFFYLLLFSLILSGCASDREQKKTSEASAKVVAVPEFNVDSAYYFVKKQVDLGPRIPNSTPHRLAGDFFISEFKKYGAIVTVQEFTAVSYDNQKLNLRNIIASIYPEKTKRILLGSHWDTRPFADKDLEKPNSTFDGANDGASGVGVLLEIARVLKTNLPPEVGVDIILFDGEDWGEKNGEQNTHRLPKGLQEWWCLGSQHWSKNKHKPNYSAYYGVLLDMVGGKNAQFAREGYSMEYAPSVVNKIWLTASKLGYAHIFINLKEAPITDDHRFVNEIAKIPMVNIISYDPTSSFGDFHHTRKDNMDIISKETLGAVGNTLLHVIYYE